MAKLAIYNGNAFDRHVDLAEREYRIGRGDQNDIVLQDPTKAVSRLHAELRFEGGRFVVADLNSQNGIWVEGKRLPLAALEPGQPITIGPYRLVLEAPETPVPGPPPAPAPAAVAPPMPAPTPEPRPEAKTAPPKASSKKAPGGGRTRSILLFGGLFAILIVAGVAIGLYWPTGQPARTSGPSDEPQAGEPAAGTDVSPATDVGVPGQVASGAAAGSVEAPVAGAAAADPTAPIVAPPVEAPPPPAARAAKPPASRPAARKPPQPETGSHDPSVPPRRPGESAAAWQARSRQVQNWYKQGTAALRDGDFAGAVERFEAIMKEAPAYRDVPTLIDDARRNLRASAQAALDEGLALEQKGDYAGALQAVRRAVGIDPSVEGADAAVARLTARMREAGEEAFKRARQYDALGRKADAIAQYERALQWLPPDHESRKIAQERLDALKGGIL